MKYMKIKIIVVGKTEIGYLREGENDYINRLKRNCQIDFIEVKEEPIIKGIDEERIKEIEGKRIIEKLERQYFNIALDKEGKMLSSKDFARLIEEKKNYGEAKICFIIGGPLGLSTEVREKANLVLSFSKMTFTHEMIRLLLLEQIYRAFEILKGSKYHK